MTRRYYSIINFTQGISMYISRPVSVLFTR